MISRFPLTVLVAFAACVWALVLAGHGWLIPASFFTPLSFVIGALSLVLLAFDRVAWSWPGVRILAQRPDLRGTWRGTLKSDWTKEDGSHVEPIGVFLVVHQTFSEIHLRLLTPESHSTAIAATVHREPDERFAVASVYRNEPKLEVRQRSPIHRGGLHLLVVGEDGDRLQGEYWTDRGTRGSIDLRRVSRRAALDYESAGSLARPSAGS